MQDYLKLLDSLNDEFLFCCFDYRKEKRPRTYYGTFEEYKEKLSFCNFENYCIYVTVNATKPGTSRKKSDIIRCRSIWVEDDTPRESPRTDFPLDPSMVVESSKGKYHYYWLTETDNFDEWSEVMSVMVEKWGCDKSAKDLSRVLRLPGFTHKKDLDNPFECRLVLKTKIRYTWQAIREAFPKEQQKQEPVQSEYSPDEATKAILSGENFHNSLASMALSFANKGLGLDLGVTMLRGLLMQVPEENRREEWKDRISDRHLYECMESALKKVQHETAAEVLSGSLKDIEDKEEEVSVIDFPPGLMGRLCQDILEMAPHPNKVIALAGGLGLIAGIVGRRYNVSGDGLNIYVTVMGDTGVGKANLKDSVNLALDGLGGNVNAGITHIGAARFTSPKAIHQNLLEGMSKVSVIEEAGLINESKAGDQTGITRVMLDLYSSSGRNKSIGSEAYSDKDKSLKRLFSPSLTVVNVSTPQNFLRAMSKKNAATSGEIARMLILRAMGDKAFFNRERRKIFSDEVIKQLDFLISDCIPLQDKEADLKNGIIDLPFDETFLEDNDWWTNQENKYRREGDTVKTSLASRAWVKTMKLSAISSVFNGKDYVGNEEYKWALKLVELEINVSDQTFNYGIGDDLSTAVRIVSKAIVKSMKGHFRKLHLNASLEFRDKGLISRTALSQILVNNKIIKDLDDDPTFRNPQKGIDKVLKHMVEIGLLSCLSINEMAKLETRSKIVYKLTSEFEFYCENIA